MILKPTIVNGSWVYLPPPASDLPYLSRLSPTKEKPNVRTSR